MNPVSLGGAANMGVNRFIVKDWAQLGQVMADPAGYAQNAASQPAPSTNGEMSQNLYGGMGGGRGWGRWTGVSTSGREVSEFGYQVYVTDQDIKYLMERDPTANFIVEGMAGDTWREGADTDSPLLNQVLLELGRLGLIDQMMAADISNRAYGLGLLVIGVKDGRKADEPLGSAVEPAKGSKGYDAVKQFHSNEDGEMQGQDMGVPGDMMAGGPDSDGGADAALKSKAESKAAEMEQWKEKARKVRDYIDYIEVYSYEEILDFKYDTEPESETFGEIEAYKVQILAGEQILETWIHASRCIPFKEDKTTKAPVGRRVLDIIFDDLSLLRQTVWSAAEGFYQRVVPPFIVEVKEDFTFGATGKAELDAQFKEFRTGVREYLGVEGVTITPLSGAATTQDPEQTIRMLISRIACGTGVPPKKLILAQRGAVSESVEDRKEYEAKIGLRQTTFGESRLRRLVDILITAGLLEKEDMKDFEVEWRPITPMSDLEKAQLENTLTMARMQYIQQRLPLPTGLEYTPTEDPEMLELLQNGGLPTEQGVGPGGFPGGGGPMGHAGDADASPLASLFAGLKGGGDQPTDAPKTGGRLGGLFGPGGPDGSGSSPLSGMFSGNADHSDPEDEGRHDWNDEKVRRQQAGFEARIEAVLYESAERMEAALIEQAQEIGNAPTVDRIEAMAVPEGILVTLQENLGDLFEELLKKSADSLAEAMELGATDDEGAANVTITANAWSANLDEDDRLKRMLMGLRALAVVNAKRLAEEASLQARQALAGGLLAGGGVKDWMNRIAQGLGRFFKQSIDAGSTIMSTTVLNRGRDYFLQRNKGVARFVEFRNPMDSKTTDICRARAGRKNGRGIIVEVGSEAYYRQMPPLHFNCRSWYSPVAIEAQATPTDKDALSNLVPKAAGF